MLSPLLTLTSVAAISRSRASTRPASSTLRAGHGFTSGVSSSEQAWLVMFGFARHYGLSPFLIRTGEILGARRPRHASSAGYGVGKCGSSPISNRDAAGSVIHAGKL